MFTRAGESAHAKRGYIFKSHTAGAKRFYSSFDSFCVLVDSSGDLLLYKHAVAAITSIDGNFRLHSGRD